MRIYSDEEIEALIRRSQKMRELGLLQPAEEGVIDNPKFDPDRAFRILRELHEEYYGKNAKAPTKKP